ncbi:MAG: NAD-binding protein [Gammaproteobacteria bacterium]|nr:NAD-binding protein [Gammaproteobacteria bacterium]
MRAGVPDNLLLAGLNHPMCKYVVALTNDNAVDLHIAISAEVVNPNVKVICRADSHEVESNMASFGTEHIIDPFDTFARNLSLRTTYAPHQLLLDDWFRKARGEPLSNVTRVPHGLWIILRIRPFRSRHPPRARAAKDSDPGHRTRCQHRRATTKHRHRHRHGSPDAGSRQHRRCRRDHRGQRR